MTRGNVKILKWKRWIKRAWVYDYKSINSLSESKLTLNLSLKAFYKVKQIPLLEKDQKIFYSSQIRKSIANPLFDDMTLDTSEKNML